MYFFGLLYSYVIVKVFIHLNAWRIFPKADGNSPCATLLFNKDELRPLSLLTDYPTIGRGE